MEMDWEILLRCSGMSNHRFTIVNNADDCDDDDDTIRLCEDCSMILDNGLSTEDGIYEIDPGKLDDPFEVYCDMSSEGGGWTLAGRQVPSEHLH